MCLIVVGNIFNKLSVNLGGGTNPAGLYADKPLSRLLDARFVTTFLHSVWHWVLVMAGDTVRLRYMCTLVGSWAEVTRRVATR